MTTYVPLQLPVFPVFPTTDDTSWKLFSYLSGTTTKTATYITPAGTANANPILPQNTESGQAFIFVDPTINYKFVLAPNDDTDPPTSPLWTIDNVMMGGKVVQVVSTSSSTYTHVTAAIPFDNTPPQITEGTQILSQSIIPSQTTNKLRIEVNIPATHGEGDVGSAAIFQDSTATAIAASFIGGSSVALISMVSSSSILHIMDAGTTSATTFSVRVGPETGGDLWVNGDSVSRTFGGVQYATMTITEYVPNS